MASGLISARALDYGSDFVADGDTLKLANPNPTDFRGSLDPAGGTIPLPTPETATEATGVAFSGGDFFLITSPGTIGATAVTTVPAKLVVNGGDTTTDAGWSLFEAESEDKKTKDIITVDAAMVAAQQITLSATPADVDEVIIYWSPGSFVSHNKGIVISGDTANWAGQPIDGRVAAGDTFVAEYTAA